jgi:UDP-N-acetylmuramoyl-tripeptide--D-alanyl-D-alanine ligase
MSALWSAADLVAATGGRMARGFDASGVSIDTRTLEPGDLFVALVTETGDGHDHVAAALAKGAAGALVHRRPADVPGDAPLLEVADTLEGLRGLGAFGRGRFGGRVVAVTGSVGKTTSKEMLRAILAAHGETSAALASLNNHWGVPLTLARLPPGARYAVVEIGMNHAGEIAPLARMARPHVALISAIAPAHIGFLGSIEAIADEKVSIVEGLEPGGIAVLPADAPCFGRMAARAPGAWTFGRGRGVDARLVEAMADAEGTDVAIELRGRTLRTRLAAPGVHMAMNAAGAILAAVALGADPERAAAALTGFAPMAGRGLRRRVALPGGSLLLLDESYNASPVAVRAALGVLALQKATRRVAVLGDMRELGEAGPALHAALAPDVARAADLVFACGPLMLGAYEAIPPAQRGAHTPDSAALAPLVAAALRDGDAVLVKGSLGTRMKPVVEAIEALSTGVPEESRQCC